jgi:hypothetical protein
MVVRLVTKREKSKPPDIHYTRRTETVWAEMLDALRGIDQMRSCCEMVTGDGASTEADGSE